MNSKGSSSKLSINHIYQLLLLIVIFIIVLIVSVWMYTGMTPSKHSSRAQTPEEMKAEVQTWLSNNSEKLDNKEKAKVSNWLDNK